VTSFTKKLRDTSLIVLIAIVAIRLAWLTLAPLVPCLIVIFVLALVTSTLFRRT
jgi:hypothetical protein